MSLKHTLTKQLPATVRIVFRTQMAFRMNFIFIFLGLPIKIAITWLLWNFVIGDNNAFRGLERDQILIFVTFTSLLSYMYDIETGLSSMENKIISGGAVADLTLPIEFHIKGIFSQWGTILIYFFVGLIMMIGLVLISDIVLELTLLKAFFIVMIVLLNTILLYYLMSVLAALSILVGPVSDMKGTIIQILQLLGGSIIPVVFLPSFLQGTIYLNPFSSLLDFPAMILISGFDLPTILIRSVVVIIWIIILLLVNRRIWRVSRDKFSAPGE